MSFNVLLLDDDLTTRDTVERSLSLLQDVHVIPTASIEDVRAASQVHSFNFAILDIDLKLSDDAPLGGIEIAKELKAKNSDLPMVAFTAYKDKYRQEAAKKFDVHFEKWVSKTSEWTPRNLLKLVELHSSTIPKVFERNITLKTALVDYGQKTNEGHLVKAVAIPWLEILREIERNPEFLWQFTKHPRRFEEFIAGAYNRLEWDNVVITPQARDRGRDLIVTADLPGVGTVQFVDECKAYSPNNVVTAKEVSRLAWVLNRDRNVSKGIVTTTSKFAPGVYDEFRDLLPGRLELKDGKKLRKWLIQMCSEEDL